MALYAYLASYIFVLTFMFHSVYFNFISWRFPGVLCLVLISCIIQAPELSESLSCIYLNFYLLYLFLNLFTPLCLPLFNVLWHLQIFFSHVRLLYMYNKNKKEEKTLEISKLLIKKPFIKHCTFLTLLYYIHIAHIQEYITLTLWRKKYIKTYN